MGMETAYRQIHAQFFDEIELIVDSDSGARRYD